MSYADTTPGEEICRFDLSVRIVDGQLVTEADGYEMVLQVNDADGCDIRISEKPPHKEWQSAVAERLRFVADLLDNDYFPEVPRADA